MSKIVIFGATGYTGGNIAREAIARGHEVVGAARNIEGKTLEGATLITADYSNPDQFLEAIHGANVVVLAGHHSKPKLAPMISGIAKAATAEGVRLAVVGGAGSLLVTEGGPRLFDTPEFPDAYKVEAHSAFETLEALQESINTDWFYVSPAAGYGSYAPGERTGNFRLGGNVLVVGEDGKSFISGADYATAFVDEIENRKHVNQRFTLGY